MYGQHAIRRATIDPPALNHYKQLVKRPSSEKPFDSEVRDRNELKMFLTVKNPSSDLTGNESMKSAQISKADILSQHLLKPKQLTHDEMLLSYGQSSLNRGLDLSRHNAFH